jgi:hypothetical protein
LKYGKDNQSLLSVSRLLERRQAFRKALVSGCGRLSNAGRLARQSRARRRRGRRPRNRIEGRTLYVAGTRRDRTCTKDSSYHQMEITYSRFEKTLSFPASIEGASIEHNFDNGLLIIRLWRGEQAKSAGSETSK